MGGLLGNKLTQAARMAQETAKAAVANLDEEGGGGGEPAVEADDPVQALCVRLSSVHYIIKQCTALLDSIVEGAAASNYTGAPLDSAMDSYVPFRPGWSNRLQ